MIELEPMSLEEWKAARQAFLDSRTDSQRLRDAQYREYYSNEAYYNSLGDRIRTRQAHSIPQPGEGLLEFLEAGGTVFRGIGTVFPVARKISALLAATEEIIEERLT
jgi:hypothetical protein